MQCLSVFRFFQCLHCETQVFVFSGTFFAILFPNVVCFIWEDSVLETEEIIFTSLQITFQGGSYLHSKFYFSERRCTNT